MAILAGNIIRATARYLLDDNQENQNVYHYLAGPGFNETEAAVRGGITNALALAYNNINDDIVATVQPLPTLYDVSTDGGATFFSIGFDAAAIFAPNAAGLPEANGVAAVIRFGGEGTGREGRKFIGGLASGLVDGNDIDAGTVTNLVTFALAADNGVGFGTGSLEAGWLRRKDLTFIPYSNTITVNTIVGYQRRRKPGVGV